MAEVLPGVEDLEEGMESEGGHGVLCSPSLPHPSPPSLPSRPDTKFRRWLWGSSSRVCVWEADTGVPRQGPTQPATPSPALMPTSLRRNSLQGALV